MFAVGDYVVCISDETPFVNIVMYVHPNGFINITTPEPTIDESGDDPSRFRRATQEEIERYVEQVNILWGKAQELINQRISDLFTEFAQSLIEV